MFNDEIKIYKFKKLTKVKKNRNKKQRMKLKKEILFKNDLK